MARTRSASAHRKVLDAALALFAERGIEGTSMDAVAEHSGVSKATIYKHWADKDALILEVMADMNGLNSRPSFDTGHTREDVCSVLSYRPEVGLEMRQKFMPHCIAYSARNPEFGLAWRNLVMEPPRRELRRLANRRCSARQRPDLRACGRQLRENLAADGAGASDDESAIHARPSYWRRSR